MPTCISLSLYNIFAESEIVYFFKEFACRSTLAQIFSAKLHISQGPIREIA